jgi:hypothetical protein
VTEAQHSTGLCASTSAAVCQNGEDPVLGTTYDSPVAGAINCRDIRIWDSESAVYIEFPACDVEDES